MLGEFTPKEQQKAVPTSSLHLCRGRPDKSQGSGSAGWMMRQEHLLYHGRSADDEVVNVRSLTTSLLGPSHSQNLDVGFFPKQGTDTT